jgi:hypothetical protein
VQSTRSERPPDEHRRAEPSPPDPLRQMNGYEGMNGRLEPNGSKIEPGLHVWTDPGLCPLRSALTLSACL